MQQKFISTDLMINHTEIYMEEGKHNCKKCGKMFIKITDLAMHEQAYSSEDKKCELCNKKFINRSSLVSHIHLEHNQHFKCDIYGKQYLQRKLFKEHIDQYHECVAFSSNNMEFRKKY